MRLALVYPPFYGHAFNENLPTVDDEFGLFPHLGFGWVARGAAAAGWDVRLFDCAAEKLTVDDVIRELEAWSPDLVGYAAHACQTHRDLLEFAEPIKRRTGLPTLVGGYEAQAFPEEILSHPSFDYLCVGESLSFLPPFLAAFERGSGYGSVPGLYWREGGRVRGNAPAPRPLFADYPTPDRSIFPNHLYYSHVSQRRHFTIGISQMGCPYSCTFCCMRRSGWDARSAEQVVDEMQECSALGIREIDWFDPLMLHDRRRALDIAEEVQRRKLDMIWSCRSRIDSFTFHKSRGPVDEELVRALAEGGCRRIYLGVESGDDAVLKAMAKGQQTSEIQRRVLECVADHGIMALGFFIIGAPGDTRASVRRTVDYSLSLPLAYAQYQIAIVKPHTELERQMVEELDFDYWREYMRGNVGDLVLPSVGTSLSRPELEGSARRAYLRFYLRPRYALGMLRRIESREELVRYARVAAQMVLRPLRPSQAVPGLARRTARAAAAFSEAMLTIARPGARHRVFSHGGGVGGAARLARSQLRLDGREPVLDAELAAELRRERGTTERAELPPGHYVRTTGPGPGGEEARQLRVAGDGQKPKTE